MQNGLALHDRLALRTMVLPLSSSAPSPVSFIVVECTAVVEHS